jgi:DNA polymerase-3 subunit alpha
MPDIDSDFASECRGLVIEYVKKKYGKNAVCCIATKATQAAKGAVRNCARLLGSELYKDTKTFLSLGDQIAKQIPNKPNTSFKDKVKFEYNGHTYADIDDLNMVEGTNFNEKELPEEVKFETLGQQLINQFSDNANAVKIIKNAMLVEGTSTHYGMHAAGVIISDNNDISDYVPLMWDEKNQVWKSQCDMVEAEENGLLKMDFLGLEQLSIITKALRLIKKRTGKAIDIEKVAIEANVLKDIYQKGLTNSIFQFESGGMKKMLRQFKPDTIEDVILLNAAYRPGPMQYLPKIIAIKQGKEVQDYLVPELEPILKNTYGSIIYQEQVMRICQDLAGFTLGGADMVRRYMSKKKADKLEHEREAFINGDPERSIKGCVGNGIDATDANELFDQMMDFAAYAFNKSHACAYSFVSYYTAWLKDHYPTEYLCADMDSIILDKIPGRIEDCKKFGIKVLSPNINKSMIGFSVDDKDILFGLGSIKNVGSSAEAIIREREENGAFLSFKDFLKRGHVKKDSTESLIKAGALDCFCDNRLAMLKVMPTLLDSIKKINDKTKTVNGKKAELAELEATANHDTKEYQKKVASLNRSIQTAEKAIEDANLAFEAVIVPSISEDKKERLTAEKELIGVYVSAHPLDEYDSPEKLGATPIADLEPAKEVKIFGIMKNVRKTVRKKDGAPMAFFQLEDKTEVVDVNCYTKAFAEYGIFVEEDAVVMITGSCNQEDAFNGEEDEKVLKVNVTSIEVVKPTRPSVLIHCDDITEWTEIYKKLEPYKVSDGYTLVVHFRNTNTLQKARFNVSAEFLENKEIRTTLM